MRIGSPLPKTEINLKGDLIFDFFFGVLKKILWGVQKKLLRGVKFFLEEVKKKWGGGGKEFEF